MSLAFTIDRGDGPEALPLGPFIDASGTSHPVTVLELWSDGALAEIGVTRSDVTDVPARVSRLQAKQALLAAGLLATVDTAVASAAPEVQVYWAEASHFHRDHPVLEAMRLGLGWTNEALDDLFIAAGAIS